MTWDVKLVNLSNHDGENVEIEVTLVKGLAGDGKPVMSPPICARLEPGKHLNLPIHDLTAAPPTQASDDALMITMTLKPMPKTEPFVHHDGVEGTQVFPRMNIQWVDGKGAPVPE